MSTSKTREVLTLSKGSRFCLALGLIGLVVAAYLFWSPIQLYPSNGFPIRCGSAAQSPADELGRAACGQVNVIRQWQAAVALGAGLLLAMGGIYAFGFDRRTEPLLDPATDA